MRPRSRRAALRALAATLAPGLAGCGSLVGGQSSPQSGTTTPSSTTRRPTTTVTTPDCTRGKSGRTTARGRTTTAGDDGPDGASIVDLQTAPRTYALTPTRYYTDHRLEVAFEFTATATADHPARFVATLTNRGPSPETAWVEWLPLFGRLGSDEPREHGARFPRNDYTFRVALVAVPTADHDLVEGNPAAAVRRPTKYWRLTETPGDWLPSHVQLDPGESVHGEYVLVGRPEGGGRGRPPGVYEFQGRDSSVQVTVWNTDEPGPDAESAFAGATLPAFEGERDVAWFHRADSTTPTFVRPGVETTDLPANLAFTFVNHARESTGCGHWNLYKLRGCRWFHVGPDSHSLVCRGVPPGRSETWRTLAFGGDPVSLFGTATFGHLGGGYYAAVAGYGHATAESGALFRVDAPPVALEPTEDVTTRRDGATVIVTSPRWDGGSSGATLAVTRAEGADTVLIAEQVMRARGLRNTLPFFEDGVRAVRLRTDRTVAEGAVRAAGREGSTARVRVREAAYELDVQ